jgi:predicted NAD/FAD-binding protein
MAAAYLIGRRHEITVFALHDYIGGHANTVNVNDRGRLHGVDTGFAVFNPERYPKLGQPLEHAAWRGEPSEHYDWGN